MSIYPPVPNSQPSSRSRLLAHWRRQIRQWGLGPEDDAGLTLIECLAAIIVVGFIGAAIAPVLVISVATRIQNQKAEQALALAQSEIDFVRTLLERGGDLSAAPLPPEVAGLANNEVASADGPNSPPPEATKRDRYPTVYQARLVDIDGDGEDDFGVQVYRTPASGSDDNLAFTMGVRVYDIAAINAATGNLDTRQASIGLASSQGDRSEQPLATLYTTVASGEDRQALCNFVDYLGFEDGSNLYDKPTGCPGAEPAEEEEEEPEPTP